MSNYVPGSGNPNAKLMVIAESPGKHEDEQLEALVGPTGKLHNEMLIEAGKITGTGITPSDVYKTNVVKFMPPRDEFGNYNIYGLPDSVIEECKEQLREEVRAINPNVILVLGDLSLSTVTGMSGITKYRGSILQSKYGPKAVGTLHPAGLLYTGEEQRLAYSARTYIQLDYNRAVEESLTKELDLPQRQIDIPKNSLDVWRFLQRYEGKKRIVVDLETPKCIPVLFGIAFNKNHAMSIPLLNVYGIDIPETEMTEIWKLLANFFEREDLEIVAQNAKFDHEKIIKALGFRIRNIFYDTMLAEGVLNPELPKGLAFITSWRTREPFYKDEGKEFNPKKDDIKRLMIYNGKDCVVTFEIMEKQLQDFDEMDSIVPGIKEWFLSYIMQFHEIYMDIEKEGFAYDSEQRRILWTKYDVLEQEAIDRMEEIVKHPFNHRSPKQMAEILYIEMGFPKRIDRKTRRVSTNDKILAGLYANHAKTDEKKEFLNLLSLARRYSKTKGTYIEAMPDYDGRYRTSYRII